jgi:hypothetical protein
MVLSGDDHEIDAGEWSDELDNLARTYHGYVVRINSEPAEVIADYRPHKITVPADLIWASSDSHHDHGRRVQNPDREHGRQRSVFPRDFT